MDGCDCGQRTLGSSHRDRGNSPSNAASGISASEPCDLLGSPGTGVSMDVQRRLECHCGVAAALP